MPRTEDDEKMIRGLAGKTVEEKIENFRGKVIQHPTLDLCLEEAKDALRIYTPGQIVLVYGPAGVGKTTLCRLLHRDIIRDAMPRLEADPGLIPSIFFEVQPPDRTFEWKAFYKDILLALEDVLIDKKISYQTRDAGREGEERLTSRKGAAREDLRDQALNAIKHRKPIVIADEAQHIGIAPGGRKLLDQMNFVKSFANRARCPFVMAGTYDLLSFRNLNGQLSRRVIEVHLPRYRVAIKEEERQFKDVLHTFQVKMPLRTEPDLVGRWEYIYERTIGCVGVLSEWLLRALGAALKDGKEKLTVKNLEKTAPKMASCKRRLDEIVGGEEKLAKVEESYAEFRKRMGFNAGEDQVTTSQAHANPESGAGKAAKKGGLSVGERAPKRDPVGVQELAS